MRGASGRSADSTSAEEDEDTKSMDSSNEDSDTEKNRLESSFTVVGKRAKKRTKLNSISSMDEDSENENLYIQKRPVKAQIRIRTPSIEENTPPLPIIIKFTENKESFKSLKNTERRVFPKNQEEKVGKIRCAKLASGGDLFVYPVSETQTDNLLSVSSIDSRILLATKTKAEQDLRGIIYGVDTSKSDTEIQFNSQGLTKAKLEEFRASLNLHNPEVAAMCETHWKDSFTVKFSSYNCIPKNHPSKGGGVAIVI